MGGGSMVVRGVGRAAVAGVNAASSSSSSAAATAICNMCTAVQARPTTASTGSTAAPLPPCVCKTEGPPSSQALATSQLHASVPPGWEVDDWEFLDEQGRSPHLVFGLVPTAQEVDEASRDLHNAIRLGYFAGQASPPVPDVSPVEERSVSGEDAQPQEGEQEAVVPWMEPPTIYAARRRSSVAEALHLFQNNGGVQNIVRSLAMDKAVWEAVWRNDEVQKFRRNLHDPATSESGSSMPDEESEEGGSGKYQEGWSAKCQEGGSGEDTSLSFTGILERTKKYLSHLMDGVMDILSSLFELADTKVFAEKDGDVLDRTIKSCMVLAIMVLTIVTAKRARA